MPEKAPPIEDLLPQDILVHLSDISTRAYGCRILGESGWPIIEKFLEEQRQAIATWREQNG